MWEGVFIMEVFTTCSQCHQTFNMADNFIEREVLISREKLMLTVLVCPDCKHEIVTQVDNTKTLKLFQRQLNLFRRIAESGKTTPAQQNRQDELTKAMNEARKELHGKYNHSSYQFDGKEYKLDIHVPNMTISEG